MKSFDSTTGEETWITPQRIVQSLGQFDLDPCAADSMPYMTAHVMLTKEDDGLSADWSGKRVWLNPPYGRLMPRFLSKMHNGIALLPARTDTGWFHELVCPRADSILFARGRIIFMTKHGTEAGRPAFASMFVSYSHDDTKALMDSGIEGTFLFPAATADT